MEYRNRSSDRLRISFVTDLPSMTKQSFMDECDVNQIISKYTQTGILTHANKHEPRYGDATGTDYHEAMTVIADANSMFEELPADVRAKFKNDPARFLDFVDDPRNAKQLVELGLANERRQALDVTAAAAREERSLSIPEYENPETSE